MIKQQKTQCSFCTKMLAPSGRRKHMEFMHPGKVAKSAAKQATNGHDKSANQQVPENTRDHLDRALGGIRARRSVIQMRILELEALAARDRELAQEQHILETAVQALDTSTVNRESPDDHPMVREASQSRGHASGVHTSGVE